MRKGTLAFLVVVILVVSAAGLLYELQAPTQPFALRVYPDSIRGDAIAGQRVVFLVTVAANGSAFGGARVSATAPNSAVTVTPEVLFPGQVGEVTVIPDVTAVGTNVTVAVRAEALGVVHERPVNFSVIAGEDWRADRARELRDTFAQWLQDNVPALGITNQTQWVGTIVSPRWLIVEHYLFFSKDWEMHVYWHVMIPPYDWARIDLRDRSTGLTPSLSYEISSVNATAPPQEIPAPEEAWR